MTRRSDPTLLAEQLRAALIDAATDPDATLEAAALAGLRARDGEDDSLQHDAHGLVVDPVALAHAAHATADALVEIDETDDPGLAWDRLNALDEACAAAWWLHQPVVVAPAVDLALRVIRAFPDPWEAHAAAASRVLTDASPAADDPALALWRAVEVAGLPRSLGAVEVAEPVRDAVLEELGLRASVVYLSTLKGGFALAADGGVPSEVAWRRLGVRADWEVALTQDDRGEPIVLVATDGDAAPTATCDGSTLLPARVPEGWSFPAKTGTWEVQVGDDRLAFELAP